MKQYITLFIALMMISCNDSSQETINLKSDPVTVTLKVTNSTGKMMRCHKTYGVDKPDVWVEIASGTSADLTSNTHSPSGTVYTCYPDPSATIKSPNPANGNFQMSYGYWNGAAHVTCDNNCNKGNPTSQTHYPSQNWKYDLKWAQPTNVVNNSVEFTVSNLD